MEHRKNSLTSLMVKLYVGVANSRGNGQNGPPNGLLGLQFLDGITERGVKNLKQKIGGI